MRLWVCGRLWAGVSQKPLCWWEPSADPHPPRCWRLVWVDRYRAGAITRAPRAAAAVASVPAVLTRGQRVARGSDWKWGEQVGAVDAPPPLSRLPTAHLCSGWGHMLSPPSSTLFLLLLGNLIGWVI